MHAKPKKNLGQNFLIDKNVQKKIVEACSLCRKDSVIEIGPGRGEITRRIAVLVSRLCAVEIDRELSRQLADELRDQSGVRIITGDILEFDFSAFFSSCTEKVTVIGNIPYYITTPIIEKLLSFRDAVKAMYFLVQKEFAERVVAKEGSKAFGSLSCFVQYFTEPQILFPVSRRSFFPVPTVDSIFLRLVPRSEQAVKAVDEEWFFRIVRQAFNQRRKQLKNSLKELVPPEVLERFFVEQSVDRMVRPEMLSVRQFVRLADLMACSQ